MQKLQVRENLLLRLVNYFSGVLLWSKNAPRTYFQPPVFVVLLVMLLLKIKKDSSTH